MKSRDDLGRTDTEHRTNPDPITGAPGSHPVGTGVGAAAAGAAGAAIGSAAGPVGTAVGAVVGAVAGGLAGKGVAEGVYPTTEDTYWRENYSTRPYVQQGAGYDEYSPAYRYGYTSYQQYRGRSFDEMDDDLRSGWDRVRGESKLEWDRARNATRDAWERAKSHFESSSANKTRPD
ncbi:MAG TPA: hypothetical protein VHA14_17355 [Bryobacteraceae bacterium]|jgi:hypothetical protein|nr:hypothetical protein [Bryobacteraceae bacterium]